MTTRRRETDSNDPKRHWIALVFLHVVMLCGLGCAKDIGFLLTVRDFEPANVRATLSSLGRLDADDVKIRRAKGDLDGVALLPLGACPDACSFALVDIYVDNPTNHAYAPPVLRLDAPAGRQARLATAFRGTEISAHRTGRIRTLVELWPEEDGLEGHLSSSIFLEVNGDLPASDAVPNADTKVEIALPAAP